jgi:hypothetical protein
VKVEALGLSLPSCMNTPTTGQTALKVIVSFSFDF